MSGFEIAAPAVTEAVGFGLKESCISIRSTIADSSVLEEVYDLLNKDVQSLLALKNDNEREVQRHPEKETTSVYNLWTQRVSEVAPKVQKLRTKYEKKRLPKWHILRRSSLSEEIKKMWYQVHQLVEEGHSKDFLVDKLPEPVVKKLDVPQIVKYPTLQNALQNIMDSLRSVKIKVIGVCGTKGVGKTTLMQNLNNNEEVAKMFDIVIFVRVSADQTDLELQQKMAKRLKVDTEVTSDHEELARGIHKHMENKKYMLILDGVARNINLDGLGIPNNNNGSKVVIATQFLHVCKHMVGRSFKVTHLSPDEAWMMFHDIVRTVNPVIDFPDIQPIARLVCNRCSCLPLLIHKIASFFKLKETAASWRAALEDLDLKLWPELENQGLEELYKVLTFCYDDLKDEKMKKCFLYTSLYPADSKVYTDYLVKCWIAQGFLGDVQGMRRYRNAHDKGHEVVEHLLDVSLLEKGEQMIYVRMNDCMRQLALHISSKYPECHFYIQTIEKSRETTSSETWQNARWVSMVDSKVHALPPNRDCSTVLALLLQKNAGLATIPQTFFENMSSLNVLDLCSTGIEELPSSLSNLTCLKALYLNDCEHLREMPPQIGSLQLLQVLDVRGTKLSFIPSHIGCLANLRCLRISYIKSGNQSGNQDIHTDNNVISKLQELEELIIEVMSYEQWCKDAESVINQVASLQNLTTLRCSFPSAMILKNFIECSRPWRAEHQISSFRFFIGCKNSKHPQILKAFEHRVTKYLKYCNGQREDILAVSEALPRTDAFELICHKDMTKVSQFGTQNLNRIRGFLIESCNQISTIVAGDDDGRRNGGIFTNLEQFYLVNLLKLKCVFRGPLHPGSLSKLQTLVVQGCPSLKSIFSNGAIQHFSVLWKVRIENCAILEELIMVTEDIERDGNMLPKLEMLELINLPKFSIICEGEKLAWSSLERLEIYECPQLKTLPFGKDKAANLRSIKCKKEWSDELEWTDNEARERIQHMLEA